MDENEKLRQFIELERVLLDDEIKHAPDVHCLTKVELVVWGCLIFGSGCLFGYLAPKLYQFLLEAEQIL